MAPDSVRVSTPTNDHPRRATFDATDVTLRVDDMDDGRKLVKQIELPGTGDLKDIVAAAKTIPENARRPSAAWRFFALEIFIDRILTPERCQISSEETQPKPKHETSHFVSHRWRHSARFLWKG
ncbi:MAG: hypothetical protein ABIP20_13815 [Chthoniobacteraceae bacterium]